MNAITIMHEIAALAGYTIDASTGDDPKNKARALRRLNAVKSDIISRYGGKWPASYREGWLYTDPLYITGTATFTQNSPVVTGSGVAWTSFMKGWKMIAPDGSAYQVASVDITGTIITLMTRFQGTTIAGAGYTLWHDEYPLYPEVWSLGGIINYKLPERMKEAWPTNMKESYPNPSTVEEPTVYTVLGRKGLNDTTINSGTISSTQNSNVWTGVGTTWLNPSDQTAIMQPGYELTVNGVQYHVRRVNSDTQLETYQMALSNLNNVAYSAKGKNAVVVRFRKPTDQREIHYWYYAKDYPLVNDNDEDWICEMFEEVIMNGAVRKDYLDKNDVARASLSKQEYEDSIKNMKVATEASYTGIRTLGIYLPPEARD